MKRTASMSAMLTVFGGFVVLLLSEEPYDDAGLS